MTSELTSKSVGVFVKELYTSILEEIDPRVGNWFLMSSPLYPLGIDVLYLAFAFYFAPKIMASPETLNISKVMSIYNTVILIVNLVLGSMLSYYIFSAHYSFKCQPVRPNGGPLEDNIAELMWYFHISKIIELTDTVFIILKKNINQLSFLHLYHHSTIVVATWIGVTFVPGGSSAIIAMINSWVHVFMYFYYKLSILGISRMFSYKKFVTIMQILQFLLTITICINTLTAACQYPPWISSWLLLYITSFLALFIQFFINTYHPPPSQPQAEQLISN